MSFQPAIASPSVGHQTVHPIKARLDAVASSGFKLIELVEDDLTFYARDHLGGATDATMYEAAKAIKSHCDRLGIKPFIFQPFWFYEGLIDRREHEVRITKLKLWMKLVKILDIRIVQIPTNWMTEGVTGDKSVLVRDLKEMAEIGRSQDPVVSFAYEGVAWGTYLDTWQSTWEMVKAVDMPNFGLCLDAYHILARDWADPTVPGCKRADGDENLRRSLAELIREVDVNKVFYVQLGDVEMLDQPLVKGHPFHSDSQLPRMAWSRNARLFAWEEDEGGCLPLESFIDAVFNKLKFRGFLSMETFSIHLFETSPDIPKVSAARGMKSWNKTMKMLEARNVFRLSS